MTAVRAASWLGAAGTRTEAPLEPDRQQARAWAQEELLKREYEAERPGPLRLLIAWVREQLSHVPAPEGLNIRLGLTIAVVLVLGLVGYVLWRTGGVHRRARARAGEVFDVPELTADEHRRAAEVAEAAGDLRTALLERFRALARSLSDRALLELTPGRTADELALRAGLRLPGLAGALAGAARSFDDVRYGGRPATRAAVRSMRELDERAARATPTTNGVASAPILAAPR